MQKYLAEVFGRSIWWRCLSLRLIVFCGSVRLAEVFVAVLLMASSKPRFYFKAHSLNIIAYQHCGALFLFVWRFWMAGDALAGPSCCILQLLELNCFSSTGPAFSIACVAEFIVSCAGKQRSKRFVAFVPLMFLVLWCLVWFFETSVRCSTGFC